CEPRPHRVADAAAAPDHLRGEVEAGRLDGEAVDAVLSAAGHPQKTRKRAWPAGLTTREVEVLRLVARGLPTRAIATQLVISPKTVEHHVGHLYAKIGVSTRAAATMFAMEHDLTHEIVSER
ncbi:MAG: response regulator transcription factor, partial [Thermoleophilaceae bacterium]